MLVENIVNLGKFIQTKLKLMIIKKKRLKCRENYSKTRKDCGQPFQKKTRHLDIYP